MGILGFWQKSPTDDWPSVKRMKLLFDIDGKALNGVVFGQDYKELSKLGRPGNKNAYKDERFIYLPLGLEVEIKKDIITEFDFIMHNESDEGFSPADLQIIINNDIIKMTDQTTVYDIQNIFGMPANVNKADDDLIVFYKINGLIMEMEFSESGNLKLFNVYPEKKKPS